MSRNGKLAVIFDLDGTLWDSSKQVVESWNTALARHEDLHRQITLEEMQGYMGKQMEVIAKLMLPDITEDYRLEILKECCEEEQNYLAAYGFGHPDRECMTVQAFDEVPAAANNILEKC